MRSRFSGAGARRCYREAGGRAAVVVGEEESTTLAESDRQPERGAARCISDPGAPPETFDAAFGLRTAGSDEGDAELIEGAADWVG